MPDLARAEIAECPAALKAPRHRSRGYSTADRPRHKTGSVRNSAASVAAFQVGSERNSIRHKRYAL